MARLVVKSGFGEQVIQLHLGKNRLGRSPENDFQIEHPSVSALHCEINVSANQLTVRDCDSTNGTFVAGQAVSESRIEAGQTLSLGDVEVFVDSTDVTIAIPIFDMPRPAPPVVLTDGSIICPRHSNSRVTHRCTHCREIMCDACVHRLRRKGGKLMLLCPLCSHPCELIGGQKKKKRSLLGFLQKTIKLPLVRAAKDAD
jgi:pSer/pThr/pTyr-binding forkhead associated (FHA) protein